MTAEQAHALYWAVATQDVKEPGQPMQNRMVELKRWDVVVQAIYRDFETETERLRMRCRDLETALNAMASFQAQMPEDLKRALKGSAGTPSGRISTSNG